MPDTAPHAAPAGAASATIADYAAIGNCRTLALVSRWGSIDWWCFPAFASPSVFGAMLDQDNGGRFAITPAAGTPGVQAYEPGTNVLHTRFEVPTGVLEILDFMSVPEAGGSGHEMQEIVRVAHCLAGQVPLQVTFAPRPHYAQDLPAFENDGPQSWRFEAADTPMALGCSLPLQATGDGHALVAQATLRAGQRHVFILRAPDGKPIHPAALLHDAEDRLAGTIGWWQGWSRRCSYAGPYYEPVLRSALALKLLTHRPTGAVVAAPTTSLPESETGARNWDYRYCWLRDTSLMLQAFGELGYTSESDAFLRWLLHATKRTRPRLQVVYDVHGGTLLPEHTLKHLCGYHGIGPVRVGNAASEQVQLDVYGEVLLTAWRHATDGGALNQQEKGLIAGFTEVVCNLWREPDQGIWEIRLPPRHNTHSKLMCWAALDRALALDAMIHIPIDAARVRAERDAIRADIDAHAWNPQLGSYVGYYGADATDASLLLMPRSGYIAAHDPRMEGTVNQIMRQLEANGLLYRYPPGGAYDGVPGPEHLFAICSFWCVDCLARQGRLDEAHAMFERLLKLRNAVGLYAEEFRVQDGSAMGNFPQAFSHVGLITAALTLQKATKP
jgi:GH15 family glucan-1,4-alpha-glucosidase